ncbi:MAG: LuxR family quorum-sensing system transcriptional regulator SolR [Parvibaculaceae bacterium]|jgi:LuxR family quorum-sensing system transcriptional regulator SolR|nr:LuxR family transcriptional regulator [Parvibaculaceae bacterium]
MANWENTRVLEFADFALASPSIEELNNEFEKVVFEFGFEEYIAISLADPTNFPDDAISHLNYTPAWQDHYNTEKFFEIDPMLIQVATQDYAFCWQDVWTGMADRLTPRQKQLRDDASVTRHRQGLTIPIPDASGDYYRGSISFGAQKHELPQKVRGAMQLIAAYFYEASRRIRRLDVAKGPHFKFGSPLTERETEILRLYGDGKTAWEIGKIQSISESTVRFHLNRIKDKYDVATPQQALVKALVERHIAR